MKGSFIISIDEKQLIFSSEVEPILHVNRNVNEIEPSSVISSGSIIQAAQEKHLLKIYSE